MKLPLAMLFLSIPQVCEFLDESSASAGNSAIPKSGHPSHNSRRVDGGKWWLGEDAEDVLIQLEEIANKQMERDRVTPQGNSWLDKFLAFFTRNGHKSVHELERKKQLNNCFFTPMNCRIGPRNRPGRIGPNARGNSRVILIGDEEKEELMAKYGHKLKPDKGNL